MATILLVDDYAPTQRIMQFVLEQSGYVVITAFDGQQALGQLANITIDLIVTDLTMPIMDGLALAREVRNDTRYSDIPIICVTANSNGLNSAKAAEAGVNIFLTKPVASVELIHEVNNLIARRIELKQLQGQNVYHTE